MLRFLLSHYLLLPATFCHQTLLLIRHDAPKSKRLPCYTTPAALPGASNNLEDGDSTEDESSQAADGAVLGGTGSDDARRGRGVGGARAGARGGAGRVGGGRVRRRGRGGALGGLARGC